MDLLDRKPPPADHRLPYGPGDQQFGNLWLPPAAKTPSPVVVFLHGGWWRAEYDLTYGGHLCAALRARGLAVWSPEFRRVGNGGGWPTTFQDVAAAFDYLPTLAQRFPLDLTRVVAAGHSAGGHLAFWLAGRHHIFPTSPLAPPSRATPIRAVVSLAGAVDLRLTIALAGYFRFAHDRQEVYRLMGGAPDQLQDRYRAANPGDLLPLNTPQTLIQGTDDTQIPQLLPSRWADLARRQGDPVRILMIPDADHFDVVDPLSPVWPSVWEAIHAAIP